MAYTQLLHRRDGDRLRCFLLLRPFGPALELEDAAHPPDLPAYDAEQDMAPRRPQLLEHALTSAERGKDGRPALPVVAGDLVVGCDRSGACCSQYPFIPTTTEESLRAVETLRRREPSRTPPRPEDVFAPAALGRRDLLTPVLSGDGCSFLTHEGCKIHALGGADAKPWTCRQYPLQVVHCGPELEISILPQCACAARTVRAAPSRDAAMRGWPANPLQGLTTIPKIPEVVAVDEQRRLPRAAYLKWTRALSDVLAVPDIDPVRILDGAARSLETPVGMLTESWLETLGARMSSEADRLASYLDPEGPQPKGARWVAEIAEKLLQTQEPARAAAPSDGMVLSLALRAHLLLELPMLSATLCDLTRIARLAGLARAMKPAESIDARLETTTLLLYLWATTRWPVASETMKI